MPMKHSKYSVVIVGSGIAGLFAAIKLSETMPLSDGILVLSKAQLSESNSRYAQGGIVAVLPENKNDSVSLHIADTLKAGCGLCDFNVVKFISENSQHAINDLIKYGVNFDKNKENKLNFTLEGAHSVRRILHVGGDATGYGIEKALVEKIKSNDNISVYEQTLAVELLIDSKNKCRGVISYNELTKEHEAIYSPIVVLATGGTGQIYRYTTNPSVTTGDGIALGIKAGAQVKDMEFIQFHPTALSIENNDSRFLISESVRGEGAKLVNQNGEYFMAERHEQQDLAPRDIVAREIFSELSSGNKVYLDTTLIPTETFKNRFPNIYNECKENNIDITQDYIPVSPAAHYCMGGIKTDVRGKTSIENLFAIGEVACTSLHGANRLASNSLLECVVTAHELVNIIKDYDLQCSNIIDDKIINTIKNYTDEDSFDDNSVDIAGLTLKLKTTMWDNVGIVRNEASLLKAKSDILKIKSMFNKSCATNSIDEYELRNMIIVAEKITDSALRRKESIGAHFRSDAASLNDSIDNIELIEDEVNEPNVIA